MQKIITFVLAQGKIPHTGGEVSFKKLKRAPHYFGPSVPRQYIIQREDKFVIKAYFPNIFLVETECVVQDVQSDESICLREQLIAACLQKAQEYGADVSLSEDYAIAVIDGYSQQELRDFVGDPSGLVSFLKSERFILHDAEVDHTMRSQLKYAEDDLVIVDWCGACLFESDGEEIEEVVELLQIANFQLLQYRLLDRQLDGRLTAIEQFVQIERQSIFKRNREIARAYREIIDFRIRSIAELDAIEREMKLIGDWYSARLYDLASRKFKLSDWHAVIRRKLESIEDMYSIVSERFSVSKLHFLELLQIILFFVLQVGWFILIYLEFRFYAFH